MMTSAAVGARVQSRDMDREKVKIRVRLRPGLGPPGEGLWAEPVDAHDGGGTYALQNNSFYAGLAVGDIVRAGVDGDGMLQLTDIVLPAPVLLTTFEVLAADDATVRAMGDRWRSDCGANWSEGTPGLLATVWQPGVDTEAVRAAFAPDEAAGRGRWARTWTPEARTRDAQSSIDFELDRAQHFTPQPTSYWAPDDPYWHQRGLDTPENLALIQALAWEDPRVARLLAAGRHDEVVPYVIGGEDPP